MIRSNREIRLHVEKNENTAQDTEKERRNRENK